ncbi:hypothetical protein [Spirosoma agri]|uniref:Uncharacterized protein n=1 Tax=Spirosoma agri TaxID=1987381 RepID=A0A6M0IJ77_9BACT|nr:hypothetical protein [Spirosoma agri]NEU68350.1 hypothetical protein [Spirosoma agri]
MTNHAERSTHEIDPNLDPTALVEKHLNEWLQLLDHLRDNHAPTDQLRYCRNQVTRLQLDLFKLRDV